MFLACFVVCFVCFLKTNERLSVLSVNMVKKRKKRNMDCYTKRNEMNEREA